MDGEDAGEDDINAQDPSANSGQHPNEACKSELSEIVPRSESYRSARAEIDGASLFGSTAHDTIVLSESMRILQAIQTARNATPRETQRGQTWSCAD